MFGWVSCAVIAASPMNICTSSGRLCSAVSIVLMTMRFSNPCAPLIFARHTSAIPPAARRESISYLLNSVPGSQGDGSGGRLAGESTCVAGADSPRGACREDEPPSCCARNTTGVVDQRRNHAKLNWRTWKCRLDDISAAKRDPGHADHRGPGDFHAGAVAGMLTGLRTLFST